MGALTNVYVDPAINANSGTGTSGDPYGDLQYALNTVTRDSTNGNQFNIKAGTAEVLSASLSLTTYGTPAETAPIVFRGYTSAANDGGIAEINCNGFPLFAASLGDVSLIELKMHSFGDNSGISVNSNARVLVYKCEIYKGSSSPSSKILITGVGGRLISCYIHDAGTSGQGANSFGYAAYNYIKDCPTGFLACTNVINNLIVDSTVVGISVSNDNYVVIGNTVYSSTAGTGTGINASNVSGAASTTVLNNLVVGYSGGGGKGLSSTGDLSLIGYNAYYNNTTEESMGDVLVNLGKISLGSSPFTNPGSGDFSLNPAVTAVIEAALPGAFNGLSSTVSKVDIGAVQKGAGTGGGVLVHPGMVGGMRG